MPIAIALAASAAIGGIATVASGNAAAKAQTRAADQVVAENRREYDLERADNAPYRNIGTGALGILGGVYGLNSDGTRSGATAPDYSEFYKSPDYAFRLSEGQKAIDRRASAGGLLNSGAARKASVRFAEDTAAGGFNDWWSKLSGLAGTGQAATNATSAAGQQATSNISNAYTNAGNARASSYANTGAAINNGVTNLASAYLYNQGGGFGGAPRTAQLPGYGRAY